MPKKKELQLPTDVAISRNRSPFAVGRSTEQDYIPSNSNSHLC